MTQNPGYYYNEHDFPPMPKSDSYQHGFPAMLKSDSYQYNQHEFPATQPNGNQSNECFSNKDIMQTLIKSLNNIQTEIALLKQGHYVQNHTVQSNRTATYNPAENSQGTQNVPYPQDFSKNLINPTNQFNH